MKAIKDFFNKIFGKPAAPTPAKKVDPSIPEIPRKPANVDITPWMTIIYQDIKDKVAEIPGPKNHPVIVAAHKAAGLAEKYWTDLVSWCASYGKYVFIRAGVKLERLKDLNAWARNGLKFGVVLSKFRYGCVVILERNGPGGDSHFTFGVKLSADGKQILCVGGNQGNSVKESWYPVKDVLGYRYPDDDMLRDMGVIE